MKAKVIKTGEIIDFKGSSINFGTATWIDSNNILHQESIPNGGIELLENTEPIDWEQRRYEIAKDIMSAQLSDGESAENNSKEVLAKWAVVYADALIEELKKGGEE